MDLSFSITKDGSHTLVNEELDETYHSRHGAIQEAYHVFMRSGLDLLQSKTEISIFEMGFGTGLNAFITFLENQRNCQKVNYYGLEKYPLKGEVWKQLNFITELDAQAYSSVFESMHEGKWDTLLPISTDFNLKKIEGDLEDDLSDLHVDLIYFDAFGPRVQPDLWTEQVFEKMYQILKPGGILVTYCCKGDVKRAMISAGFQVEKIPGPPGKREMLRAFKA